MQSLHLARRLANADEYRPADDRVADVQLANIRQRRDRANVYVIQSMPRVKLHLGFDDPSAAFGHFFEFRF